jgi:steroid delta-isomerase-like uncharacterized protein
MSAEQNKNVMRRVYEAMGTGDFSMFDEVFDRNFVDHEEFAPGTPPGLEGVKQTFGIIRKAFPDLQVKVNDLFAGEGDKIVARITLSGTHKGELFGIPATGKAVNFEGLDIIRFSGGKIVEHWGLTDDLGMMQQLGVVKTP